jgi:hypothetical protein
MCVVRKCVDECSRVFRDRRAIYARLQQQLSEHGEKLAIRDQELERRKQALMHNSYRVLEGDMKDDEDVQPEDDKKET